MLNLFWHSQWECVIWPLCGAVPGSDCLKHTHTYTAVVVWQPGNRQPFYNLQPVCYICSLNCFFHLLIMGQCGITSSKTVLVFLNLIFWVSLKCLTLNLRVRQCLSDGHSQVSSSCIISHTLLHHQFIYTIFWNTMHSLLCRFLFWMHILKIALCCGLQCVFTYIQSWFCV